MIIKWISKVIGLFLSALFLSYILIYIPDYLSYEPWNPVFVTMGGIETEEPLLLVETPIAVQMYWSIDCPYCSKQREILRVYFSSYSDMVTLIYINAWETKQEVHDYIAQLENPVDPNGIRELWLLASEVPSASTGIPYCIMSRYEDGEWITMLTWQSCKSGQEINQLLEESQDNT